MRRPPLSTRTDTPCPYASLFRSRALVFDIGGGSTELTWVALGPDKAPQTLGWVSLPCGVVTLAERWGGTVVSRETYDAMLREVGALLADRKSTRLNSSH